MATILQASNLPLSWGYKLVELLSAPFHFSSKKTITLAPDYKLFTDDGEITPEYISDIRQVLLDFLSAIDVKYPEVTFDQDFTRSCHELALQEGFQPQIVESSEFQVALHGAAAIATTTYAHLESNSTRQYICLYTTCLIYFDDLTRTDASCTREFQARFLSGQPQLHPLLDSFASWLKKAWDHFLPACANLVVSSSLDFVTGLVIDHDQQSLVIDRSAASFPRWFRTMMGVSTAFVIYTFPPDIPMEVYIQIIPDMVNYIDDVNDLFSFYKEERIHENTNHISLTSKLTGKTKLQCMRELSTYALGCSRRCQAVLSSNEKAYQIFKKHFLPGYIGFHASAWKRYKLDHLNLA